MSFFSLLSPSDPPMDTVLIVCSFCILLSSMSSVAWIWTLPFW